MPAADQQLGLVRGEDVAAFQEALTVLAEDNAALFFGSGPSAPLYGSWDALVADLLTQAGLRFDAGDPFAQLDLCRERIGARRMAELLIRRFGERRSGFEEIHAYMAATRFGVFVTPNYDCCLERAAEAVRLRFDPGAVRCYPDYISPMTARTRSLFHIHGRVRGDEDPNLLRLVLAGSDYKTAYDDRPDLSDFLSELLICGSAVVFCGFGFRDHDLFFRCLEKGRRKLQRAAEEMQKVQRTPELRRHYAFVQVEGVWERGQPAACPATVEERLEEFRHRLPDLRPGAEITPILYADPYPDSSDLSHMYLTRLFKHLAGQCPYAPGPAAASGGRSAQR